MSRSRHLDQISVDRFLRFDPQTAARYEAEHGAARIAHLAHTIRIGLVLYGLFFMTAYLLMPDVFWQTVIARNVVSVFASLALIWLISRVSAEVREWLVTAAMVNVFLFPVFFFWVSEAPLAVHTVSEPLLVMIFGNVFLMLRFDRALVFNGIAIISFMLVLFTRGGLSNALIFSFSLQFITASVFTCYGNYMLERRRAHDYVKTLRATLRAEQAETSSAVMHEMSQTDALTQLPNRRYLDAHLADWFASSRPVAIMMIDLDHFKSYNDSLGHPAGDDCLRQVAAVFAKLMQGPDMFCARFGGEEFIVVIRDAPTLDVARVAQSILRGLLEEALPHPARPDGLDVVTASIGIAFRQNGKDTTSDDVLLRADDALYAAKRRGRNRFVMFDRPEKANLRVI